MDTRAFLEAVWPASGIYCLATPFTIPGTTTQTYAHRTVTSIADAVAEVGRMGGTNIFFAVHTLKQAKVWNPAKRDLKTGEMGAYETRTHDNMHEARCFFFDLDVGESTASTPKYTTRQEALDGLEQFLFHTHLPEPLITSSGGGYHVYWRLSESLLSQGAWVGAAARLHHLARRNGLRVDPSRTTDQSSVLRVVGTQNIKPGHDARPCSAIQVGVETLTSAFLGQLADLTVGYTAVVPASPRPSRPVGNLQKVWDGPVPTLDEVSEVCEHVSDYRETGYTEGGYVAFYHLGCGIIPFVEDGERLSHELAMRHPRCTDEYAEATRDTYNERTGGNPSSCANLDAKCGGDACARCPFAKLGVNPLDIATKVLRAKAAPPPVVTVADVAPALIVEPPHPFARTVAGLTKKITKSVKGVDIEEEVLICPYDFFPFNSCERTELELSFSLWAATIPNKGQIIIKVPSALLQDTTALHKLLSDYGVYLKGKEVMSVQEAMQVWLRKVQIRAAAERQHEHLGWVDEARTEFVMPTTVSHIDGTQKPSVLSAAAKNTLHFVHPRGDKERSIAAMQFYNHPRYLKHQFMIMAGLAAPMFHATGLAGVVVNASGESGGSKSTALYGAASLWGAPTQYVINGTDIGSTLLARIDMIFTLANLPVCMDEITEMDPRDAKKFVLNATQYNARIQMRPDGTPKPVRETFKSTPLLCSSNSSLHNLLGIENRAGIAGSMRVFEIFFPALSEEFKPEADAFLREIKENYGHIGPAFLALYMARREEIDEMVRATMAAIDRQFRIAAPERYYSAQIAAALVAGKLALEAGLLPFETEPVREWLLGPQLAEMRGVIVAEKVAQGPAAVLASFLNDKMAQTITVFPQTQAGNINPDREPKGAIVAHQDKAKQTIDVRKDAFRRWCDERYHNGLHILGELQRMGIIIAADRKVTLGRDTPYAAGRTVCFTIDMTHPEFAAAGSAVSKVVKFPGKQQGVG